MQSKSLSALAIAMLLLTSCSNPPKQVGPDDPRTLTKSKHAFHIWHAADFSLTNLGSVLIAPVASDVPPQVKPKEADQFERIREALGTVFHKALTTANVSSQTLKAGEEPHATHTLQLTIVDYYPGNPALRFTAGFGAGFPSLTVRGNLKESATGKELLIFEVKREFEPRGFEYGDEQILQSHARDMGVDFADVLQRWAKSGGLPK